MNFKCLFGVHDWETEDEYIETGTYSISGTGGKNKLQMVTKTKKIHQRCQRCDTTRVLKESCRK